MYTIIKYYRCIFVKPTLIQDIYWLFIDYFYWSFWCTVPLLQTFHKPKTKKPIYLGILFKTVTEKLIHVTQIFTTEQFNAKNLNI